MWYGYKYITFFIFFCRGASIQANLYAVHYDKKLFPEPTKFKPERFCVNGKIGNTENVMPFGCGELFFNKAKTDCN